MDIYCEQAGKGEKVIFIHGAGGSTKSWYFQKEALQRSMEVLVVDLPGHGRCPGDGYDSVAQHCDSLYHLLSERPPDRYFIAGHSMGGAIGMSFALAYPHLVKGLILIGTGAKLAVLPAILEGIRQDKAKTVGNIVAAIFSDKTPRQAKETAFNEMMQCSGETIFRDFSACNGFNIMDKVAAIKAPPLIICGKDDLMTPPKYSEFLHRSLADSRLSIIEDAGHMVMLEKPDEVNKEIEEFVKLTAENP
ncbi:MAG: Pimeloyl-(acyl-carrier protein) methyl ester esterase [Syntrophorhabdus sp. PtaU1.Bin058]|nr:MAG: Pimeloyl-(acyl-carrier protein) methyl ester esterase [Syntrophorhabdus sp. PtaU1.Bin058]